MNTQTASQPVSKGLGFLIETLKQWEGFPAPTEAVLSAWNQSLSKRRQLMIPLGSSSKGQWLKVPARSMEDLAHLLDDKGVNDYASEPPRFCPACQRRLNSWDCSVCGHAVVNLERFIKETLASMHPVQHLPLKVLLLPDPERQRLIFTDLNRPGHVLWEIQLQGVCESPQYALYLPEHQILLTDRQSKQILIIDLMGRVLQRLDRPEHQLIEPVMTTAFLAPEGEQRYLVVDRGGNQILILKNNGELHWRYGELHHPSYAALTAEQTLLIADTGNGRVLELMLPHGRLQACYRFESPIWVQRLENRQMLILEKAGACLHRYSPEGQLQESLSINVEDGFNPHQIFARRNGQLVFCFSEHAFEVRPGLDHFSGFWDFKQLSSTERPSLIDRPVMRQTQAHKAPNAHSTAHKNQASSFAEALQQSQLFSQARPEVLALARKVCRCIRLKAGQTFDLGEQACLIYIAKGQIELSQTSSVNEFGEPLMKASQASKARGQGLEIFGTGVLLGEETLAANKPAGRELKALVPTKLFMLSRFSLDTLLPFMEKSAKTAQQLPQKLTPQPSKNLSERVKQLLSKPRQENKLTLKHQGIKLNLYYTPTEREILLSVEDYRYRSYEVQIQFLPQRQQINGEQLEHLVKVFQLIKAHGFLVKHRWFDNGRLFVAHVILNGIDTAPLKRKLQQIAQLDKLWVEPVVFAQTSRKKPRPFHLTGA